MIWFGLMGSLMLAFLGLITSIWAEKFDHAAAVSNFVVAPLSLLSGTFYSIESLSPAFRAVSHANPFFYVISGFRYGFLGVADSPVLFGALLLLGINALLGGAVLRAAAHRLEAEGLRFVHTSCDNYERTLSSAFSAHLTAPSPRKLPAMCSKGVSHMRKFLISVALVSTA